LHGRLQAAQTCIVKACVHQLLLRNHMHSIHASSGPITQLVSAIHSRSKAG
jgi:hypothetical protein